MEKLCPFNQFQPCKGEQCAVSTKADNEVICSLPMLAHEMFMLTELKMQELHPTGQAKKGRN